MEGLLLILVMSLPLGAALLLLWWPCMERACRPVQIRSDLVCRSHTLSGRA